MGDCRQGLDWGLDLLTTSVQVIITLSLISKLYRSLQHTLSHLSLLSLVVFWQRILTVEILQLLCSRRYCPANIPQMHCCSSWLTPGLAAISHQPPSLLFTDWLNNGLTSKLVSVIISRHGNRRFQQLLYCCAWTRHGNLFVSRALPSNGSTSYYDGGGVAQ
jgi:hypothetical protein